MKDELTSAHTSRLRPNPFSCNSMAWIQVKTLHPSAFILHPCLSVSAQKLLNVGIFRATQTFVRAAEDHPSIAHHQNLAVD